VKRDFLERMNNTDKVFVHFEGMQTILADQYRKPMEDHLSAWILEHPTEFQEVLRRAYAAGHDSSAIGTQASSRLRAKPFGQPIMDRVYELNHDSARLARDIVPDGCYIVGTISSSNPDFLEPLGTYRPDEVYEAYLEQIQGLVEGGVDVLRVVGNHIDESLIAIKVIKDNYPEMPVWALNVFYAGRKGFRTMMGLDPLAASSRLQETGADVIGFGCGLMSDSEDSAEWYPSATALLKEVRKGTDRYLTLAPDAGMPHLVGGETVYPASPEEMADEVLNWIAIGARVVGGCCGTDLEHGRRISEILNRE
jgi:5-methyltetrahydrofolate--homocysteine methyltransferase